MGIAVVNTHTHWALLGAESARTSQTKNDQLASLASNSLVTVLILKLWAKMGSARFPKRRPLYGKLGALSVKALETDSLWTDSNQGLRRPPSWIFKSWKFWLLDLFAGPICINVPSFVLIAWTVAETWPFFLIFQDGGVRHLEFWKVQNFTYRSNREGRYASPGRILCRSVELLRRYGRFSSSLLKNGKLHFMFAGCL